MTIHKNAAALLEIIKKANKNRGSGKNVILLAACKGQNAIAIEEAIHSGITDFGENRVQEAQQKWQGLRRQYPAIRLHLIGPLQTNKVAEAVTLFDVIQSLDRAKLAEALAESFIKSGKKVPCYIQVNTGEESQKAGILPQETDGFIGYCKKLDIPLLGLMCVPPADQPPAPHFALLRAIAERHQLPGLSMGMSGDFETAIRMGSTCVRVGTALFGARG